MGKINITVDDIKEVVYRCVSAINESVKKPITVLWLDDDRAPEEYIKKNPTNVQKQFYKNISFYRKLAETYDINFVWVKTYDDFVEYIETNGLPDLVSFDHDLEKAGSTKKGAACARWLKSYCEQNNLKLPMCYAHSANSGGRKQINRILGCGDLNEAVEVQYNDNDKIELVKDPNVKNGGNFLISRNGKQYWVSRSTAIILNVYCKNPEGEWCLLSAFRGKKSRWGNKWNVINGYLDYGETIEECALKECWEEAGVKISETDLHYVRTDSHRRFKKGDIDVVFYAVLNGNTSMYPTSVANCENGEIEKAAWIPIDEVKEMSSFAWLDGQGGKAVTIFKNIIGRYENKDLEKQKLYSLLNDLSNNGSISKPTYNKIVKLLSMENEYRTVYEAVKKSIKKIIKEDMLSKPISQLTLDDIDGIDNENGKYVDSEGEDDVQYAMNEINGIIKEAIDKLYDLQEFLNGDEYVQSNKDKYARIIHNVGYLIDRIDSIWTEEL